MSGTFLLVKSGPHAMRDACHILDRGLWPLWEHTRCRHQIGDGDSVAIYIAGRGTVVATASVQSVLPWTRTLAHAYRLPLEGVPSVALFLVDVCQLVPAINVRERLAELSFIKRGSKKWGAAFMGGARKVSSADFVALTRQQERALVAKGGMS
jgi:hypothetical protein